MALITYIVGGGDDACYGPRFGPVRATELGEISSAGGPHLLLELQSPLQVRDQTILMLAVRPRYLSDTLASIRTKATTVGIWRVLQGQEQAARNGLSTTNSEYWAIGQCTPR